MRREARTSQPPEPAKDKQRGYWQEIVFQHCLDRWRMVGREGSEDECDTDEAQNGLVACQTIDQTSFVVFGKCAATIGRLTLRGLVRGRIRLVKVDAVASAIEIMKIVLHFYFKLLAEFHEVILEHWEDLATKAMTSAVKRSGLDERGQLMRLADSG